MRLVWTALLACAFCEAAAQTITVTARPFGEVAIYPERQAFANVVTLNDSRIAAEVSARIVEIPVEVGQTVERGTVLVRLDARDFELAARQADAALEAARARSQLADSQLERAKALVEQGFVSSEALSQRESEARAAAADVAANEAALAAARRNVQKSVIGAPFRAIVRERLASVGEIASPGMQLLRVLDASRIEVSAQIQPPDAEDLRRAKQPVFIAQTGERYALKLVRIVPALDARERSQEARLRFARDSALPGTAGRLVWRSARAHLPPELAVRRNGQLGAFVAEGNKARFVPLPDAEEGRAAPADLPASTAVITEGRLQLQPGDAVRLSP
jgi:RND family efflux transporter MFP subunit